MGVTGALKCVLGENWRDTYGVSEIASSADPLRALGIELHGVLHKILQREGFRELGWQIEAHNQSLTPDTALTTALVVPFVHAVLSFLELMSKVTTKLFIVGEGFHPLKSRGTSLPPCLRAAILSGIESHPSTRKKEWHFIAPPCEADSQLHYLVLHQVVDVAIFPSDDSDQFLYRSGIVCLKSRIHFDGEAVRLTGRMVKKTLTDAQVIAAMLAGCDYFKQPGVSVKKADEYVQLALATYAPGEHPTLLQLAELVDKALGLKHRFIDAVEGVIYQPVVGKDLKTITPFSVIEDLHSLAKIPRVLCVAAEQQNVAACGVRDIDERYRDCIIGREATSGMYRQGCCLIETREKKRETLRLPELIIQQSRNGTVVPKKILRSKVRLTSYDMMEYATRFLTREVDKRAAANMCETSWERACMVVSVEIKQFEGRFYVSGRAPRSMGGKGAYVKVFLEITAPHTIERISCPCVAAQAIHVCRHVLSVVHSLMEEDSTTDHGNKWKNVAGGRMVVPRESWAAGKAMETIRRKRKEGSVRRKYNPLKMRDTIAKFTQKYEEGLPSSSKPASSRPSLSRQIIRGTMAMDDDQQ